MITVGPTQDEVLAALGNFLQAICSPTGIEVVVGQVNRVPQPLVTNHIVMWPILRTRLETNVEKSVDTSFVSSIAGTVMTVTNLIQGNIQVGAQVFGPGLAANTYVASLGTGVGGVGTYNILPTQTIASKKMASGVLDILQPTQLTVQIDVHGPVSGDNAQVITTLLRDSYGVEALQALNSNVFPLFASEPRQMPFKDGEQQYEDRWIVEANLQVNQVVVVLQQFADVLLVDVISVEAAYS